MAWIDNRKAWNTNEMTSSRSEVVGFQWKFATNVKGVEKGLPSTSKSASHRKRILSYMCIAVQTKRPAGKDSNTSSLIFAEKEYVFSSVTSIFLSQSFCLYLICLYIGRTQRRVMYYYRRIGTFISMKNIGTIINYRQRPDWLILTAILFSKTGRNASVTAPGIL